MGITALDMAQCGWAAGGYDMRFDRIIRGIEGDRILVDAPIVQGIDQRFGGGYLFKYTYPERLENIGLEGMRGESTQDIDEIGNTGGNLLPMTNVKNAWVPGGLPFGVHLRKRGAARVVSAVSGTWSRPPSPCERPPTAQQWNIGGVANTMSGNCTFISFGKHVEPKNLYGAQLAERLGPAAVEAITRRPE